MAGQQNTVLLTNAVTCFSMRLIWTHEDDMSLTKQYRLCIDPNQCIIPFLWWCHPSIIVASLCAVSPPYCSVGPLCLQPCMHNAQLKSKLDHCALIVWALMSFYKTSAGYCMCYGVMDWKVGCNVTVDLDQLLSSAQTYTVLAVTCIIQAPWRGWFCQMAAFRCLCCQNVFHLISMTACQKSDNVISESLCEENNYVFANLCQISFWPPRPFERVLLWEVWNHHNDLWLFVSVLTLWWTGNTVAHLVPGGVGF